MRVGKIHGRVHTWKDGMADWERLETIDAFEEDVAEAKRVRAERKAGPGGEPAGSAAAKSAATKAARAEKAAEKASDKRKAPRRPLVAKILMADHQQLIVAICRDISVGGMQVLTDRIPGEPGARIKMNVSPASARAAKGAKGKDIEPFVAEGVIVRILEDGRGFSFRFDKLPERSRQVIEDYIK